MDKHKLSTNIKSDLFEQFKSVTRENGFKQMSEVLELLMQKVVDGDIIIKKQTKTNIDIDFKK